MRLHSPQFEKSLRRRVKRTIQGSPELKREFRAANKFRRHYNAHVFLRLVVSVLLGLVVWQVFQTTGHLASALAVVSLWAFAFIFIHANGLWSRLFSSADLGVLSSLPVPEATIFRWELQKCNRLAFWLLIDFCSAFGSLAFFLNFSVVKWCAVACILLLTWVFTLALAALCAARVSRVRYCWVPFVLALVGFVVFIFSTQFGLMATLSLLDPFAPSLNLLLPTSCAVSLFRLLPPNSSWLNAALVVPVAAVIYTLPGSLNRLRSFYVFYEGIRMEPRDLVPTPEAPAPPKFAGDGRVAGGHGPRLGPTAIEEIIQGRLFLNPPQWPVRGWFERLLWRWFSPRERVVSEFVFPDGLSISAGWQKILRTLGIATVTGFTIGFLSPMAKLWICSGGIFVTFVLVLARIYESGRAFQGVLCSGVRVPIYTNFSVGFRELARLLVKFTVVQMPALLLWSAICGVLITHLATLPVMDGIMHGLRGGCLLFAGRFLLIIFGFSSGTNDTAIFGVRSAARVACILVLGGLFLLLGGIGLLVPKHGPGWILTSFAILDAYLFFRIYAWFYHRNRFDLMSLPRH
jgi:hypothetical protein